MIENSNQENSNKKLWFKAKRYGWGWYPSAWQGWVTILAVMVFILLLATLQDVEYMSGKQLAFRFFLPEFAAIILLIWICYKKGEKPRWRWGEERKPGAPQDL